MLSKPQVNNRYAPLGTSVSASLSPGMRAILAWATIEEHDRVLDLCCQEGALLENFSNKYRLRACGMCEYPEQARDVRARLPEADVIFARPDDIPWQDNAFDVVVCSLLPQSADLPRVFSETLCVLRPGGQFVLSAPTFSLQLFGAGNEDTKLNKRELMRSLQAAGFDEVSWRASGLQGVTVGWKRMC